MKSISPGSVWVLLLLAAKGGHASHKDLSCLHPNGYKKWRKNPKVLKEGDNVAFNWAPGLLVLLTGFVQR